MSEIALRMRKKLETALAPVALHITDESHLHSGHAGAREGGESHFHIEIASCAFHGLSRIDAQRKVYTILKEELAGPVHALRLTIRPMP